MRRDHRAPRGSARRQYARRAPFRGGTHLSYEIRYAKQLKDADARSPAKRISSSLRHDDRPPRPARRHAHARTSISARLFWGSGFPNDIFGLLGSWVISWERPCGSSWKTRSVFQGAVSVRPRRRHFHGASVGDKMAPRAGSQASNWTATAVGTMFTSEPPTCTGRTLDLPRKDRDIRYLRPLGNSDIAVKTMSLLSRRWRPRKPWTPISWRLSSRSFRHYMNDLTLLNYHSISSKMN